MSNKRIVDFRNRKKRLQELNADQGTNVQEQMMGLLLGLSKRIFELERELKEVKTLLPIAKAADYRSLSVQRILEEKAIIKKDEMLRVNNDIIVEDFDLKSIQDDKIKGLEVVEDRPAQKDDFVILNLKFFKDGKELEEEEYPRSKVCLGSIELFPELHDAVMGMKVGGKKLFPVELMGQTDHSQVTLIGIRQKRIVDSEGQLEDQQNARNPNAS